MHISQLLIFTPNTIGFGIFRGHTCGNLDYTVSSRYIMVIIGSAISVLFDVLVLVSLPKPHGWNFDTHVHPVGHPTPTERLSGYVQWSDQR
jgi:hypothetical protein